MSSIERLSTLDDLQSQLAQHDDQKAWSQIEATLQAIADILRVRGSPEEDNHTVFGKGTLPQTLTKLLSISLHGSSTPTSEFAPVVFQILRVAANLCMDHDVNRGHLLDAGFPQATVALLRGYSDSVPADRSGPFPIGVEHLKVIRTAIGVLLNASLSFDLIKNQLNSLETGTIVLNLATALYPTGSWVDADLMDASSLECWQLRNGQANWAWKFISELKEVNEEPVQILGPDILATIVPTLSVYIPPFEPLRQDIPASSPQTIASFIQTDFEILEECCTLIESMALDVSDVRLSLARGLNFPSEHGGVSCLTILLNFIQDGTYHPFWSKDDKRRQKSFDVCKAAIIKVIVEVAGEEGNEEVLWDDSEPDQPGGIFVSKMVQWIKSYADNQHREVPAGLHRDDLAICASLSLGNLARRDHHATILLSPPHNLGPILTSQSLLSPTTDLRLKHGVIGLLRQLAQTSVHSESIQTKLSEAHTIQTIAESGIWEETTNALAETVQVNAIGVMKFLCAANIENTFAAVLPLPSGKGSRPPALMQILALVKRADSVRIKSEGTRVLVNIIRSLWSSEEGSQSSVVSPIVTHMDHESVFEKGKKRQECIAHITTEDCSNALAALVGRSGKFPILVNEGVVALSLLASQKVGAPSVLKALLTTVPNDIDPAQLANIRPSSSASTSSEASSPAIATPGRTRFPSLPRRTLDVLLSILEDSGNPIHYPIEIRMNVCSLFIQLGKNSRGVTELADDVAKVKETALPALEQIANGKGDGKEALLIAAAKKATEVLR